MNRPLIKQLIKDFDFKKLFNELGWDNHSQGLEIYLNDKNFNLQAVAIKKEFVAFVCLPDGDGREPEYKIRKKLETKVTPFAFEHIIIFYDKKKSVQVWQWVKREQGKPTATRETKYYANQDPELLVQKLVNLEISLDEEESLGITDIKSRTKKAFDVEKVTKEFYTCFKKEHDTFLNFIQGVSEQIDKDWYTSLMLNRLMFIYFIQKKNFLNNDQHYLKNKLSEVQKAQGNNKFHSFYKTFLLELFHKGLGSPERTPELNKLLGKIPYLNGGLFDVHYLELKYDKIDIPDKAFEKIFEFFDGYEWHLDTRLKSSGKDINPDVIGYIFEKYINDRASMGAYYTKEDITDYISKNCIIPFLFDEVQRNYKAAAFDDAFEMLSQNPDQYVYDAVKYGVQNTNSPVHQINSSLIQQLNNFHDYEKDWKNYNIEKILYDTLPEGIREGIYDVPKRNNWNKPAPPEFALPTEIWREVIDRHRRYYEITNRILSGQITTINDFITYNLNIRQFLQDVIENTIDPFLLKEIYSAIKKITILDPTCGSGAFLFEALNILEPLYEACIQRMQNFVDDAKLTAQHRDNEKAVKFKFFEEAINEIFSPQHPNEKYFIYKSIILNNLHGVDIMNEAVEIAKLRLFLKLVSTVEADYKKDNLGLEPLPDIDFNIRAGNTLVGFVKEEEAFESLQTGQMDFYSDVNERIKEILGILKTKELEFRNLQSENKDNNLTKSKKEEIINTRMVIHELLNIGLAKVYGIDPHNTDKINDWRVSHQPFHWFFEFPEIMSKEEGGFDVIIGNPPYVEYASIRNKYTLINYNTISSGNLYSFVIERSLNIEHSGSYNGMIIPISAYCTDRMDVFQENEFNVCDFVYLSHYAERPSKLFEGAERNLTISILRKTTSKSKKIFTSYYYKWNSSFRDFLFCNISYIDEFKTRLPGIIPKISTKHEQSLMLKLRKVKKNISNYITRNNNNVLYYRNSGGRYWKIITDFQPNFYLNGEKGISSRESYLYFTDSEYLKIIVAILNSSLYYWYYIMHSDARTNNPSDLKNFPIDFEKFNSDLKFRMINLCKLLMKDIEVNSIMQKALYRTGDVEFQQFFPQKSKHIIDEIDQVLAEHYGFTDEELDFIINYDIKYRMGKELEEEITL